MDDGAKIINEALNKAALNDRVIQRIKPDRDGTQTFKVTLSKFKEDAEEPNLSQEERDIISAIIAENGYDVNFVYTTSFKMILTPKKHK